METKPDKTVDEKIVALLVELNERMDALLDFMLAQQAKRQRREERHD